MSEALVSRSRRSIAGKDGNLLILAADHTARGKISLGKDTVAMADRYTLLDRLVRCLHCPRWMACSPVPTFWKSSPGWEHSITS